VGRQAAVALYVLTLVVAVVGVDVLFFSHHFWERLIAMSASSWCLRRSIQGSVAPDGDICGTWRTPALPNLRLRRIGPFGEVNCEGRRPSCRPLRTFR
jgi:hypothetical protein